MSLKQFAGCLLLCGLLSACGGAPGSIDNGTPGKETPGDGDAGTDTPGDTPTLTAGCDWFPTFVVPDQNYAFPDLSAVYYLAAGPNVNVTGKRLRIEGRYPQARYSSLHVYSGRGQTVDHLADFQLVSAVPGQNPYFGPATHSGAAAGAGYVAYVVFDEAAPKAINTMHRPAPLIGATMRDQQTFILYRVYTPPDGSTGGELPRLVLETPSGDVPLAQTPDAQGCSTLRANVREFVRDRSTPQIFHQPTDPPTFELFDGILGGTFGGGVFRNEDSAYLASRLRRSGHDLVVMRARAPSYLADGAGNAQLRFWSVCQNEYQSERVVGCTADQQTPVDSQGFFNVVVSPPELRPANADAAHGYAWLPYGNQELGFLIYRHMLPSADFAQAIQNAPARGNPASSMGDYAPRAVYCSKTTFESAAGRTPAEVFAACGG